MDFIVSRTFNSLYIILDIVWLLIFASLLLHFKKRQALIAGILAGFLYFIVDYGIFYKALGTRHIEGADPLFFLLWLSMSYGFTNFAWIWILLDRDKHIIEWSLLPVLGWITIGQLSQNLGSGFGEISIWRGTGAYHGIMALILLIGYLYIILNNLKEKDRVNILWLMAIGTGVQFAWEFSLLISGIRATAWQPVVINSLIETNLGLPYAYYIHRYYSRRWNEDLSVNHTGLPDNTILNGTGKLNPQAD